MNLEELQNLWSTDCVIDDNHFDRASVTTPKLHSKYLNYLIEYKLKHSKIKSDYNTMRARKFRYYRGELSREELTDLNWNQWQGIKPLRNEMDEFLNGDSDLNSLEIKSQYIQSIVEFLESIMQQIKSRDWQIRNAITWRQFVSGS